MANEVKPLSLKREGDGLKIEWSDGTTAFIPWRTLRANCPCASCIETRAKPPDPFRVLTPQEAAAGPPEPVSMKPVGHYAYQITWNDGHSTGIYPIEALRKLAQQPSPDK
ncbi:MAG TPA: DUF971 domain-containing protein [Urbifossiella sp.]|jgi:DUF971 family protein